MSPTGASPSVLADRPPRAAHSIQVLTLEHDAISTMTLFVGPLRPFFVARPLVRGVLVALETDATLRSCLCA